MREPGNRPYTRHRRAHPGLAAISYLHPFIAICVGIVHASVAPLIVIGGAKPNLVLVAVVLVTVLMGFLPGIIWAFAGGLAANLLVGAPLGSVPLAMLIVAALAAGGARAFGRLSWVYPVAATLGGSVVADAASLAIGQLMADAPNVIGAPTELILAAALLNAAMAAILLLPARVAVARLAPDEAPAW